MCLYLVLVLETEKSLKYIANKKN